MARPSAESFVRAWNTLDAGSTLNDPSASLVDAISGYDDGATTAAGVSVSPEKALSFIPFYAGVRYLAESIGSLPFPVYRREGRSRLRVSETEDRRQFLLNDEPNPFQTAMQFWETMIGHANCWGNGYALVEFGPDGVATALWLLDPRSTAPYRAPDGSLWYGMWTSDGTVAFSSREVIHLKAFGTGDVGISPVGVGRQAIGEQLAAEDYAGRFWQNDASPGGVIQYTGKLKDPEHKEAVRRWNAMHQGVRRKHLVAVLDNGATWTNVGMPLRDAQFLEARKWGYRQMASLLRVPPHKIADLEGNVTFASIDAQEISAVTDSLRPWCVRLEQSVKRVLFPAFVNLASNELSPDGRARKYPEFLMDGLLRGDHKTRATVYGIGRQWGWYSIDDVREMENLPSIGAENGGDVYLQPMNMVPAGTEPEALATAASAAREFLSVAQAAQPQATPVADDKAA